MGKNIFWIITLIIAPFLLAGQENDISDDTVSVLTYKINGRTALGYRTTKIKGQFVAISPDLLDKYPLKSKIKLSNCSWKGVYRVLDIMGKKNRKTVDIYYKGPNKNKEICICSKAG